MMHKAMQKLFLRHLVRLAPETDIKEKSLEFVLYSPIILNWLYKILAYNVHVHAQFYTVRPLLSTHICALDNKEVIRRF